LHCRIDPSPNRKHIVCTRFAFNARKKNHTFFFFFFFPIFFDFLGADFSQEKSTNRNLGHHPREAVAIVDSKTMSPDRASGEQRSSWLFFSKNFFEKINHVVAFDRRRCCCHGDGSAV
jgi:hypothetical protein